MTDDYGEPMWLLGDNFLRGWYSIHDADEFKMGFAPLKGNSKLAPISVANMG
jgi:hypothetical protein